MSLSRAELAAALDPITGYDEASGDGLLDDVRDQAQALIVSDGRLLAELWTAIGVTSEQAITAADYLDEAIVGRLRAAVDR